MDGRGTLMLATGETIETTWENGYRHGDGTITYKDGTRA